jgi:hypothetical protein
MTGGITLFYDFSGHPNDDFGWLSVIVDGEDCRGGTWVQWHDVVDFAGRLAQYPISSDAPVEAEWGFAEEGNYTRTLLISLSPIDAREQVAVTVDLVDYHDSRRRCHFVRETTYSDIAAFRGELDDLMAKSREKAVLRVA